ncbi:hypothetical protein RchiOBHm_Chr4g0394111 [Rosa chinensis]|uniref:Uncharacterized protein n=1 Tax=Rosa chinensis TaxID=74649 RepID=A0A2P6QR54_ROSCH|nr:hypothetical protein RchiOBHm_Chr4g0394111 [Rosa chinensis]
MHMMDARDQSNISALRSTNKKTKDLAQIETALCQSPPPPPGLLANSLLFPAFSSMATTTTSLASLYNHFILYLSLLKLLRLDLALLAYPNINHCLFFISCTFTHICTLSLPNFFCQIYTQVAIFSTLGFRIWGLCSSLSNLFPSLQNWSLS